jgi:hydrogenase maturation protease
MHFRILILGLGNDILTDDAVGLVAARRLGVLLADEPGIEVRETMEMGLALLDYMTGYDAVLLLDAIRTGRHEPGTVMELDPEGLHALRGPMPHFLGVGETLALGRELGLPMPDSVKILAMEVEDPFTLGTELTTAVREALPEMVRRAERQATTWALEVASVEATPELIAADWEV